MPDPQFTVAAGLVQAIGVLGGRSLDRRSRCRAAGSIAFARPIRLAADHARVVRTAGMANHLFLAMFPRWFAPADRRLAAPHRATPGFPQVMTRSSGDQEALERDTTPDLLIASAPGIIFTARDGKSRGTREFFALPSRPAAASATARFSSRNIANQLPDFAAAHAVETSISRRSSTNPSGRVRAGASRRHRPGGGGTVGGRAAADRAVLARSARQRQRGCVGSAWRAELRPAPAPVHEWPSAGAAIVRRPRGGRCRELARGFGTRNRSPRPAPRSRLRHNKRPPLVPRRILVACASDWPRRHGCRVS